MFNFPFCWVSVNDHKGHAYIEFTKEKFQSEECITHNEC